MSTQSTAYPNPTCDACECQANPGCGGEVCPVNFADGSTELNRSFMRTEGVGNFKLTYYNGWKVDGAAADYQGPVGYNWTIDAFPYVTTGGSGEIIFTWAPGRRGKSVWF